MKICYLHIDGAFTLYTQAGNMIAADGYTTRDRSRQAKYATEAEAVSAGRRIAKNRHATFIGEM